MKFEGVTRVRMVATSATRDVGNAEEFFKMTEELLGEIQPGARAEVISGEEEALLSFQGAVRIFPRTAAHIALLTSGAVRQNLCG